MNGGLKFQKIVTDFTSGNKIETGGTYDLALNGSGFFQDHRRRWEYLLYKGWLLCSKSKWRFNHFKGRDSSRDSWTYKY